MDFWRKVREDGTTGFRAVCSGLAGMVRGGRAVPEYVRLQWRLRDTKSELAAAYTDLGRYLASRLAAGSAVQPDDDSAKQRCARIEALLIEERQLREELARDGERGG